MPSEYFITNLSFLRRQIHNYLIHSELDIPWQYDKLITTTEMPLIRSFNYVIQTSTSKGKQHFFKNKHATVEIEAQK